MQNRGVCWKSERRGIYDPTSLVRRIISLRHAKLEIPCMNDPISRELNQKIPRFNLHFQHADQSNYKSTITRSGDSKNVPLVPNKQVPLRVKPSTYILAQIRSYLNRGNTINPTLIKNPDPPDAPVVSLTAPETCYFKIESSKMPFRIVSRLSLIHI